MPKIVAKKKTPVSRCNIRSTNAFLQRSIACDGNHLLGMKQKGAKTLKNFQEIILAVASGYFFVCARFFVIGVGMRLFPQFPSQKLPLLEEPFQNTSGGKPPETKFEARLSNIVGGQRTASKGGSSGKTR